MSLLYPELILPTMAALPSWSGSQPDPVHVREMVVSDLKCGFLETLEALTDVRLTPEEAIQFFYEREKAGTRTFVAVKDSKVVGTASLIIERKFIHRGGLVGHIEDVAVRADLQKQGIGACLVQYVISAALGEGCYKVILNCAPDRMGFYIKKLGFRQHDCGMRLDRE